jgi:hypothetical protein
MPEQAAACMNHLDFQTAIQRVRACYAEDPGLCVSSEDLARLSGMPAEQCSAAVRVLNYEGVLHPVGNKKWVRSRP